MLCLGIDPGLSGGLALVEGEHLIGSRLIEAVDIPVIGVGAKRRVDAAALLAFVQRYKPDFALIERAQTMPDQGSSSGFIYGRAVGYLEMAVLGMQIPLEIVETRAWKQAHGLIGLKDRAGNPFSKTQIKEASRQRALFLWPMYATRVIYQVGHHNRAEAALIAAYGIMLNAGTAKARA